MLLWKDVNLDKLVVSPDGRSVQVVLSDMTQGMPLAILECSDCFLLNFQNIFSDEDGFACYIGEVKCDFVEGDAVSDLLVSQHFMFSTSIGHPVLPLGESMIWVHLEGGDVLVKIGCRNIFCNQMGLGWV
ncbi:hypothetical protein [Chitinimonas lacunae]